MTMTDTIFTRIIKGEIPCHKVYEDGATFAFLDIHPVQPGHVLVIPKKPVEFLWDLDDPTYEAVMATTKKVAQRIKEVLKSKYVGLQVIGESVPHAHVQIIPFSTGEEFYNRPDITAEPDHEALDKIASQLFFM